MVFCQELKTVSPITFREDIVIEKIYIGTEGNLTGSVGDILTIKGDYLNLMWGVTFTGGVTVTDLITHDRYTITVAIPKEAANGKITLTDTAETPTELQSEEAISINLPTAILFTLVLVAVTAAGWMLGRSALQNEIQ